MVKQVFELNLINPKKRCTIQLLAKNYSQLNNQIYF